MPEIIFLGTGSSLNNLTHRNLGGFVLRTEDVQVHFDPGPGALIAAQAFGVNAKKTDAVISSRDEIKRNNETSLLKKISDKNLIEVTSEIKKIIKINDVRIQKIGKTLVCGYNITAKNFTLAYIFQPMTKDAIRKEKLKADVVVLYNKYLNKGKDDLGVEDSNKIISIINPKLAVLTGFSPNFRGDKHIQVARELKKKTGVQVVAADDGVTVDLLSYSALAAQKKLFSFTK